MRNHRTAATAKVITAILIILFALLQLVACGREQSEAQHVQVSKTFVAPTAIPTTEPTPTPTPMPTPTPTAKTDVQRAYEIAVSLSLSDLEENGGNYTFYGINISGNFSKESVLIRDGKAYIDQGEPYKCVARQLYFSNEIGPGNIFYDDLRSRSKYYFGVEIESDDEVQQYLDSVMPIFNYREYPLREILTRFQTLSVSSGKFDFENASFDFQIDDLSIAATELKISQEVLGYIFGMLDEYAAKTVFNGNSCTCAIDFMDPYILER